MPTPSTVFYMPCSGSVCGMAGCICCKLCQDALRAFPLLTYVYPGGSAGLSHSLRTVVDDPSATVPYLLGEFASDEMRARRDGAPSAEDVLIVWTLNIVGQASLSDSDRMHWVLECLTRVGIEHGVRKGLVLKESLQGRFDHEYGG